MVVLIFALLFNLAQDTAAFSTFVFLYCPFPIFWNHLQGKLKLKKSYW